ncbi:hypothetical protein ACFL0M_13460 [Thermodesulfobacteriota bacterium]
MMKLNKCFVVFVVVTIFAFTGSAMSAPKKPTTLTELALYKGADRQKILEEGAKHEGKLTIYTTHIANRPFVNAFQKKYPYIKVHVWRASTPKLVPRVRSTRPAGLTLTSQV